MNAEYACRVLLMAGLCDTLSGSDCTNGGRWTEPYLQIDDWGKWPVLIQTKSVHCLKLDNLILTPEAQTENEVLFPRLVPGIVTKPEASDTAAQEWNMEPKCGMWSHWLEPPKKNPANVIMPLSIPPLVVEIPLDLQPFQAHVCWSDYKSGQFPTKPAGNSFKSTAQDTTTSVYYVVQITWWVAQLEEQPSRASQWAAGRATESEHQRSWFQPDLGRCLCGIWSPQISKGRGDDVNNYLLTIESRDIQYNPHRANNGADDCSSASLKESLERNWNVC